MDYKVLVDFRDKDTLKKYIKNEVYSSDNKKRAEELINKGYIEGGKPSLDSLLKKEIIELLEEKGIEFDSKATKPELIELLEGE